MILEHFTSSTFITASFEGIAFVQAPQIEPIRKNSARTLVGIFLLCLSLSIAKAGEIPGSDKPAVKGNTSSTINKSGNTESKIAAPGNTNNESNSSGTVTALSTLKKEVRESADAPTTAAMAGAGTEFNFSDAMESAKADNSFSPKVEARKSILLFNLEISSDIETDASVLISEKSNTFLKQTIHLVNGINRKTLDVSSVPAGTYWLKIITAAQTETVKIFIK